MPFPFKSIPALQSGQGFCPTCAGLRYVPGPNTCPTCKGAGVRNDNGGTAIAQVRAQSAGATYTTVPDPVVNSAAFSITGIDGTGYTADGMTTTVNVVKISDGSTFPATTCVPTPTGFLATWSAPGAPTVAASDYLVQVLRSDASRENHAAHLTVT